MEVYKEMHISHSGFIRLLNVTCADMCRNRVVYSRNASLTHTHIHTHNTLTATFIITLVSVVSFLNHESGSHSWHTTGTGSHFSFNATQFSAVYYCT